jgi:hypothetical protein
MIQDITRNELAKTFNDSNVTTEFFVTSQSLQLKDIDTKNLLDTASRVEVNRGRPDVKHAVLSFVDEVYSSGSATGRTAVLVCGPAAMSDAVRYAVRIVLKDGKR